MTQKIVKQSAFARATIADIKKEMAKPRVAESVRAATEAAQDKEKDNRMVRRGGPRERRTS